MMHTRHVGCWTQAASIRPSPSGHTTLRTPTALRHTAASPFASAEGRHKVRLQGIRMVECPSHGPIVLHERAVRAATTARVLAAHQPWHTKVQAAGRPGACRNNPGRAEA
eukprot:14865514-Alexandrium_andersonii.AAC.1